MSEPENKQFTDKNTTTEPLKAELNEVDSSIEPGLETLKSEKAEGTHTAEGTELNNSSGVDESQLENIAGEEVDLQLALVASQAEVVKMKDAFLRAKAEEDNVRRRSEKEVANSRKFAVEGFAKEMMNVRDSLVLACSVELAEDADDAVKSTREGVEITLKQLDSAFAKFAVIEISPGAGDKLDPNLHQAMTMIESEEVESGHIISVIQCGFSLHDRLLRPAMVVVAK